MLKALSRFVCITASQSSLVIFLNVISRVIPALLTKTSIGPIFFLMDPIQSVQDS